MINLLGIYTIRDTKHPYYWDVVYEWEDEMAKALQIPLIPVGKMYDEIYNPSVVRKVLNRFNFYQAKDRYFFEPGKYYLAFHIGPPGVYSFHSRKDVIPVIIDFWQSENLRKLESVLALNKIVFVTSKQVYSFLREKNVNIKLAHLALSLPDCLLSSNTSHTREFDLIQIGRQNKVLTGYVETLLEEYPNINYLYSKKICDKIQIFSTLQGKIGEFNSRQDFLTLLRNTKISLVSGPGMDDDKKRTGGFSPVTPRFFESAACGCHIIGTYPDNEDFSHYGINEICVNVKDYESFRHHVLAYLESNFEPKHDEFLRRHLTSKRANELMEQISLWYGKQ